MPVINISMASEKSSFGSANVRLTNTVINVAPDKSSSMLSGVEPTSNVIKHAKSKELFDYLVNCFYGVHFMCFEMVEKDDYLHLTLDHKAVEFFVDICKSNSVGDIRFLQGKLGQADADVLKLMKHFYKGDKFIDFFLEHEEFEFEPSLSWIKLSEDYDIYLEGTINQSKDFVRTKYYLEYLCDLEFFQLCRNTFEGLLQLASFLRNKKKARLSRLCGHISTMHSFLDCINRLNGKNQSEKLMSFLDCFDCFVPVEENDYALSEEVKSDIFFNTLQKFCCKKWKESQEILLSAHNHCSAKDCPEVSLVEHCDVTMQIIKRVDSVLNSVACFCFKELPQILGVRILHICAYHLKFSCSDLIWVLLESGLFDAENGLISRKSKIGVVAAVDESPSEKIDPAENQENIAETYERISITDANVGLKIDKVQTSDEKIPTNQDLQSSSCSHENVKSAEDTKKPSNINVLAGALKKKGTISNNQKLESESVFSNQGNMDSAEDSKKLTDITFADASKEKGINSNNRELEFSSCNHENVDSAECCDETDASKTKNRISTIQELQSRDHLKVPLMKILRFAVKLSDQSLAKAYAMTVNKEERISGSDKIEEFILTRNSSDKSASSATASEETCTDPSDASNSNSSEENGKEVEKLYFPTLLKNLQSAEEKITLLKSFEFLLSCYYTVHFFCFEVMTLFEGRDLRAIRYFINVLQSTDGGKSNLKCLQRKLSKAEPAVSDVIRSEYKSLKHFFMSYSEFVFNTAEHSVQLAENFRPVFNEQLQRLNSNCKSKLDFENFCDYPWIMHCASTFGGLLSLANCFVGSGMLNLDDLCDFASHLGPFSFVIDKLHGKNQSEKLKLLLRTFNKIFTPLKDNLFKLSNEARKVDCNVVYRSLSSLSNAESQEKQVEVLKSVHNTHLSRYCITKRLLKYEDFSKKVVERVDFMLCDVSFINFSQLPRVWGGYILHSAFHFGLKCSDLIGILLDSGLFNIGCLKVERKKAVLKKNVPEVVDKNLMVKSSTKDDVAASDICEAKEKSSGKAKNADRAIIASGAPIKCQSEIDVKVRLSSVKIKNQTKDSTGVSVFSSSGIKGKDSVDFKNVSSKASKESSPFNAAKKKIAGSIPEILQNIKSPLGANFQHMLFGYLLDCFFTVQFLCFQTVEREEDLLRASEYEAAKFFVDILKTSSSSTKGNLAYLQSKLCKSNFLELKEVKRVYQGAKIKEYFMKHKAFVFNPFDSSVSLSENYAAHMASVFAKSKEYLDKLCSPSWAELCGRCFEKMLAFIHFLSLHQKLSFCDLLNHLSKLNSSLGVDGLNEIHSSEELKVFLSSLKVILPHGDKSTSYSLRDDVYTGEFIKSLNNFSKQKTKEKHFLALLAAHFVYLAYDCNPEDLLNEDNLTKRVVERVNSELENMTFIRYFELPRVLDTFLLHSAFHLGMSCSDIILILSRSDLFVVQYGQISKNVGHEVITSSGNLTEMSDKALVDIDLKDEKELSQAKRNKVPVASSKKSPLEKSTKVSTKLSKTADVEHSLTCRDSNETTPVDESDPEFDIFKFALNIAKGDL